MYKTLHTHPNQGEIFLGPSAFNFLPKTKKNLGSLSPGCKNRRQILNHGLLALEKHTNDNLINSKAILTEVFSPKRNNGLL